VFGNILENAIKYRQPDLPVQVTVSCRTEDKDIIVCIGDNGIGIPSEYSEKIFNIFQRLHSDEEYPGTGIGLATVQKSSEMLNGQVWVESIVGKGSNFFVKLPKE
jgi:signal transduction histidine kinase